MKNTKKRLVSLLLAVGMLLATGCSEKSPDEKEKETTTTIAETTTEGTTTTAPEESEPPVTTETPEPEVELHPLEKLPESDITPALWKLETDGGATIYFMGSMHALPEEAYSLPKEIMDAYKNSEAIAVECDIVAFQTDLPAQFALSQQMIYTDGTTFADHVSPELYDALVDKMNEWGIYSSMYEMMKPAAWQSFIEDYLGSTSDVLAENGFDGFFLEKAKKEGKEIIEVESVASQMDMMFGFSDEINELLLSSYLEYTPEMYAEEIRELYEIWAGGDWEEITSFLATEYDESLMTEDEIEAMKEYDKQMMHDRNKVMSDKLIELSKGDKDVFFYVGLAHYVGDTGILAELDKAGVEYERVEYN